MSDVEEIKSDHQPTPNGMVHASYAQQLERELNTANERIKRLEEDYYDLIMQVERAFDGETRHQTAKRYIQNAECVILDSHETNEVKP